MASEMGRRSFLKKVSAILVGTASGQILEVGRVLAKTGKVSSPEYRTLGKTGLKVTTVGMGVMNCSDIAVVLRAYDLGVNFYDTADCYMGGRNEEMVGKAFKGKRDKVFIQTKVHDKDDEKKMRDSVERSLRRLQTDYLDVLVWHGLNSPQEVSNPKLQDFMVKMKKEGKARFTGFSAHSRMAPLLREAAKIDFHDVALVSYNFTHSKDLRDAVAIAAKSGIGVVAMKTQSGGYKKEKMEGLNPHQAALKYILRDVNVSAAVPGVTTTEEIDELASVMGSSLARQDLHALDKYQAFLQGRVCTLCGGCSGECPYGIAYGDLLRALMYQDGYENPRLARETFLGSRATQTLETCTGCSSCSAVCKRGLNIREQIQQARTLLA